jgi:hypothetical protein
VSAVAARVLTGVVLVAAGVVPAAGQTMQPRSEPKPWEFAGGVTLIAPVTLDTPDASLVDPAGGPFTLFALRGETGAGFGVEAMLSTLAGGRVDAEIAGSFTRFDVRALIESDTEDVPDVTLAETLTRFGIEGAAVWRLSESERATWFARGGIGWLRELTSDDSVAEDGLFVNVGAGVKYWLKVSPTTRSRFGVRVEGRALFRRRGIELEDRTFRLWPVLAGSAVFRF